MHFFWLITFCLKSFRALPIWDKTTVQQSTSGKKWLLCEKAVIFAATIGVEIDRLIAKYSRLSPAKAFCYQAIGAERVEELCDGFCESVNEKLGAGGEMLKPRFSPGYGDLPLETQKMIFSLLDCPKRIGVSLGDSLLMSPSKSVTAFAGITKRQEVSR